MSVNMWFCCDRCGNLDNLKLTVCENTNGQQLCSRCWNGAWHDAFPEEKYDNRIHVVINRPNIHPDASEPSFG